MKILTKTEILKKYENANNAPFNGSHPMTNGEHYRTSSYGHSGADLKKNHTVVISYLNGMKYVANVCNGYAYLICGQI